MLVTCEEHCYGDVVQLADKEENSFLVVQQVDHGISDLCMLLSNRV